MFPGHALADLGVHVISELHPMEVLHGGVGQVIPQRLAERRCRVNRGCL